MNHMNEVAKMLGVELGEEFEIEGDIFNPYRVTSQGLSNMAGSINNCTLLRLLTGSDAIVKKPWKPKNGERYYAVDCNESMNHYKSAGYEGLSGQAGGTISYWSYHSDESEHIINYKIGNCFRTKEEITPEIIEKYVNFFKSDEQIQI